MNRFKKWFIRPARQATGEERYQAAKKVLKNLSPEVLHDALLIVAMTSPMALIEVLQEAGATVIERPVNTVSNQPTNEVIN